MAKKKSSTGLGFVVLVVLTTWALSSTPEEWRGLVFVAAAIAFLILLLNRTKEPENSESEVHSSIISDLKATPNQQNAMNDDFNDVPVQVFVQKTSQNTEYRIPASSTLRESKAKWIAAEEIVEVKGFKIAGGLFYLGSNLKNATGGIEPALIDPKLPIASHAADPSVRHTDYWPNYSHISSEARSAYLQWLADGRKNPAADIGYVFLFFYGLERRSLIDVLTDSDAKMDIPKIADEVRRLRGIYSENHSFQRYAEVFLQAIEIQMIPDQFYKTKIVPPNADLRELPFNMRIGLGQLAVAGEAIPPRWAYCWSFVMADYKQRRRALRCPVVFEKLFASKYQDSFGTGLKLPLNKTKLKLEYNAASSGMPRGIPILFKDSLPDVTATNTGTKKLLPIFEACAEELDAYGRFVTRNGNQEDSLEALLQLPVSLWPDAIRTDLEDLKSRIGSGQIFMSFGELSGRLKNVGVLNRNKVLGLARALEKMQVGIEPDVLAGARIPQAQDVIALFTSTSEDAASRLSPEYKTAAIILELSCAVALADGIASQEEVTCLVNLVESWKHLSTTQKNRLKTYVHLQIKNPEKLTSLKKKLEGLAPDARLTVAAFSVHLAQADGIVRPSEVQLLEKIYSALGIDTQKLYSILHIVSQPNAAFTTSTSKSQNEKSPLSQDIVLDATRIAMLKKETEQVSALLAGVFSENENNENFIQPEDEKDDAKSPAEDIILLGLDAEHRAFLHVLNSRTSWMRSELLDVAADMKLLLDGALERINDVAFDQYGEAFCEGDDPVEINAQLMGKLAA